jgi:NAD(P)-dependent dehydrogenase (short-subunit alcohol dehydrogenase family)
MNFDGKVVLITGAGKGAGRLLAQSFAALGARVAANDISPVNLDDLVRDGNGSVQAYTEDIAKKVGVQAVVKQVEDDFGRIDILVNHAAVEPHTPLLEMDEWDWHRVLDVNLTGAFLTMQSVGRMMRESGSGHIINVIHLGSLSAPMSPAYAASLHGLIALTRAAASELGRFGVYVNAVGRGLPRPGDSEPSIPRSLNEAVFYLCSSALNGQIVSLEES